MITVEKALAIHQLLIDEFGGPSGVRDQNALESAINRPLQTFGGQDLYPEPAEKAAAMIESIVSNHPFIDGNKRTGYVLMRLTLLSKHMDIEATQEEKYQFVIDIASGKLKFEEIRNWIKSKVIEAKP